MATKMINKRILRHGLLRNLTSYKYSSRTILSDAYACHEEWEKRLEDPILKRLKMSQFFIDVDKTFQTKRLASGAHIDMFVNNVTEESQLEELEHLLYRFRKSKRATEMLDSSHCAIVRVYLNFRSYDSLFRILRDRVDYGVFPDLYTYNILMDHFLKLKVYRDAVEIALMMMLQEDFSNHISRILAIYSCQKYLDEQPEEWLKYIPESPVSEEQETEKKADDEDDDDEEEPEEIYVRVPYLRNPWFDDHFDIKDPKVFMGKIFYLNGCEEDTILGRTYRLVGLGMWDKWEKASAIVDQLSQASSPVFFEEGVSKFNELLSEVEDAEIKEKWTKVFQDKFEKLQKENKLSTGMSNSLDDAVKSLTDFEPEDIRRQKELFEQYLVERKRALQEEEASIDKEERLKIVAQKKEELFWKEKLLFFFENEKEIKREEVAVDEIIAQIKVKTKVEELYEPPAIVKKKQGRLSKYKRLAMIKHF